ncbi:putative sugar isomerase [Microlunatus phosphovorus NM-1]|uniref:Putative sugar isomerase n=1 Tax=Microlunatus phosphovorus (strain ATCC 700054 / DSM 10555 / JCM 9379 / NBRC 101784 / NCIMB 13414 / VKM Ac-1990 / NM-1) TaxID=1032480 RepID=F5XEI1_MICPN|nr:SIS domain-containing protein [Microlunatus phosphovorus]BAK35197.1 putative sugar isomerase [Microlunatus phosphovorus NM-1]
MKGIPALLKFNEEEFTAQLASAAALRPGIEALAAQLGDGVKNVYFLGAGGSYAEMMPYALLLQTKSTLPGVAAVAQEFMLVPDTAFGEGSVAVFVSATGSTPDVNKAIDWAKAKGAVTVGFTGDADSPFAQALDHVFLSSAHSYDIQLLLLVTGLLQRRGEFADYERFADQLALLPSLLVDVAKQADSKASVFANKHRDVEYLFVVGSGNVWGYAYLYSMCVLEECQWLHTTRVHAAEFFHGSLELIEKDTTTLLFYGEDETRPLMDRVRSFVDLYCDDVTVFDTADYPLEGIDPSFRALLSPLVIGTAASRLSTHLELVRNHRLDVRRYYRVVEY